MNIWNCCPRAIPGDLNLYFPWQLSIADSPPGQRIPWSPYGGQGFFGEASLKICFIDEAGDPGNPSWSNDQPVLVIGGVFVDAGSLAPANDLLNDYRKGKDDI